MNTALKPLPAALPNRVEDFLQRRKFDIGRNFNDLVEKVHLRLIPNSEYIQLLYATYDEQAVEGSLSADNVLAAKMIREEAMQMGDVWEVANAKLATINKALNVVLRRYGLSRKERRITVGGESVTADNGE